MLQAQLKGLQTKTLNITMSLPSRTALATSQASALVGNILSFTRTKLHASLKVEPLRCFGISWFVFMCFPVVKQDLVYLSIFIYCASNVQGTFHQPPCSGTLPGQKNGTSMEDNISVAVTEIFPASCEIPARAVLENLWNLPEPWPKPLQILGLESCRSHSQPLPETLEQVDPLPRQEPSRIHPIQKANLPEPARNSAVPKP